MSSQPRTAAGHTDFWWWLRRSGTRRMFARALGGGEHPNDTYLRMATVMLDKVANEIEAKPWKGAAPESSGLDVERLARALCSRHRPEERPCPGHRDDAAAVAALYEAGP